MFEGLRKGIESLKGDNLTPSEERHRRNLAYRQRVRQGSTPVVVSGFERREQRRKEREEEKEKRKMDRALLKALEKRK